MPGAERFAVAKRLEPLGLRRTLIVVKGANGYAISRIKRLSDTVELAPYGTFDSDYLPRIGRLGVPDPQLGIPWKNSMAFYGKWFDEIGETDVGYHLRRNIASLSQQRMLEQVRRDDQYALIGSYYSVFRTIMDAKHRVPLILIDDTFLSLVSFPVVLPKLDDPDLVQTLLDVLHRMLRPDPPVAPGEASGAPGVTGIEVDER